MNGGLVPLLLLSATIGLMLAFVARRTALIGLVAFIATGLLAFAIPVGLPPPAIFAGLWLSTIAAAILVYFPVARWSAAALPICVNAGFWMGACAALSGNWSALGVGFLPVLVAFPASWLTRRKFAIVIKVIASWMIAIASLSLFVSLIPTPGYKPDHME